MTDHDNLEKAESTLSAVLESSVVKFTTVVALVAFISLSAWNISAWFTEINAKLETIEESLTSLAGDRWRRQDMIRWCRETELVNTEVDFKCGEI